MSGFTVGEVDAALMDMEGNPYGAQWDGEYNRLTVVDSSIHQVRIASTLEEILHELREQTRILRGIASEI